MDDLLLPLQMISFMVSGRKYYQSIFDKHIAMFPFDAISISDTRYLGESSRLSPGHMRGRQQFASEIHHAVHIFSDSRLLPLQYLAIFNKSAPNLVIFPDAIS